MCRILLILIIFLVTDPPANAHSKYSKEVNERRPAKVPSDKPFRMQKLNLLWQKAVNKQLDDAELQKLYEDFKHQDKDELALKKLKAENQDKDGLKEAEVRRQLRMIIRKYDLEYEEDSSFANQPQNDYEEGPLFKDSKLDKLWKKAQKVNLSEQQLKVLKEELRHYELKLKQYHQLINLYQVKHSAESGKKDSMSNRISEFIEVEEELDEVNLGEMNDQIKQKHLEMKDDYKRISDLIWKASSGEELSREFEDEKAAKLWQLALKSDFTEDELESLRDELLHFQSRVQKLNFFANQLESDRRGGKNVNEIVVEQGEHQKHIGQRVKELDHHVNILHQDLERRILQRHSEL